MFSLAFDVESLPWRDGRVCRCAWAYPCGRPSCWRTQKGDKVVSRWSPRTSPPRRRSWAWDPASSCRRSYPCTGGTQVSPQRTAGNLKKIVFLSASTITYLYLWIAIETSSVQLYYFLILIFNTFILSSLAFYLQNLVLINRIIQFEYILNADFCWVASFYNSWFRMVNTRELKLTLVS